MQSFDPLQESDGARAARVTALTAKSGEQGQDTSNTVLSKEQARELTDGAASGGGQVKIVVRKGAE